MRLLVKFLTTYSHLLNVMLTNLARALGKRFSTTPLFGVALSLHDRQQQCAEGKPQVIWSVLSVERQFQCVEAKLNLLEDGFIDAHCYES